MSHKLSFKEFMRIDEKVGVFFKNAQTQLGIDPDDYKHNPQVGSFFNMGGTRNFGSYKINGFERDSDGNITYVKCSMMPTPNGKGMQKFRKIDGDMTKVPNDGDEKVYLIPIKKLNSMMGAGMGGQMGGGGGMPGMGGGMLG